MILYKVGYSFSDANPLPSANNNPQIEDMKQMMFDLKNIKMRINNEQSKNNISVLNNNSTMINNPSVINTNNLLINPGVINNPIAHYLEEKKDPPSLHRVLSEKIDNQTIKNKLKGHDESSKNNSEANTPCFTKVRSQKEFKFQKKNIDNKEAKASKLKEAGAIASRYRSPSPILLKRNKAVNVITTSKNLKTKFNEYKTPSKDK